MGTALTIICSILGSSAVFGFVQFLIIRRDEKKGKFAGILKEITNIKHEISVLSGDMKKMQVLECRIRILRASDEIRRNVKHSKEFFDQLNDDITKYQQYCENNPEFKNNRAVMAIQNINDVYIKALKDDNFL